jgi:hypothetical protein
VAATSGNSWPKLSIALLSDISPLVTPTLVLWFCQASLTPLIALVAVYVAYQQWRTNSLKSKLDLFDRRFRVFEEMRTLLGAMLTIGADTNRILDFWSKTAEAEFLFGGEIAKYQKEIADRATAQSIAKDDMIAALDKATSVEERTRLAEARKAGVQWATKEIDVVAAKFKKYLNLRKM